MTKTRTLPKPIGRSPLGALVLLSLLLGAGPESPTADLQANRQRIANMTADERARLEENYRKFLSLPADEQDRLRMLHTELEADRRQGGTLRAVLNRYEQFLRTLTAFQRADLRRETDVSKRIQLVQQFLGQQRSQPSIDQSPVGPPPGPGPGRPPGPPRGLPPLNPSDRSAVIKVVERRLKLPREIQDRLQSATPIQRELIVVIAATRQFRNRGAGPPARLDGALMDEMLAAIKDTRLRKSLEAVPQPEVRRFLLIGSIVRSLQNEIGLGQQNVQQFYQQLDDEQRAHFAGLSPDRAQQRLRRMYLAEQHPELAELFDELRKLGGRGGPPRPGRPFGPGNRPEGFRNRPPRRPSN